MNISKRLHEFPYWKELKKETQDKIITNATYNKYNKETILYLEAASNPSIYLILSGYVVVSKISSTGREKYLYYLSEGDLVNQATIDGSLTTATAKTTPNTEVISIHKDLFLELMEKDFKLCSMVLNSLALKVRRSQRQILNLGVYNTTQRTVSKLLKLSRDYGKEEDGYLLIDAPINQTDLAYMVGASREAVNRCLKKLEGRGIIFFIGHTIAIVDRDKLLGELM